jgi:hypothetical protein
MKEDQGIKSCKGNQRKKEVYHNDESTAESLGRGRTGDERTDRGIEMLQCTVSAGGMSKMLSDEAYLIVWSEWRSDEG